jgi:hypothetical protein
MRREPTVDRRHAGTFDLAGEPQCGDACDFFQRGVPLACRVAAEPPLS